MLDEEGSDSSDKEDDKKDKKKDKKGAVCDCPMLDKMTLLEHLPSLTTVTLIGVTALFVLSSNQSLSGHKTTYYQGLSGDKTTDEKHKGLRQFLISMPFTVFLFGLAVVGAAVSVKRKPGMLGCAAGILLIQLICLVVTGGVVSLVRAEVDKTIVWPVTAVIIVALVLVWTIMCAYPKLLRRMWCCCCLRKRKEKVNNSEDKCDSCGGPMVDGISLNQAVGEGVERCESCGGVARADAKV